jgi:hydroxymethylbilane synthase
MATSRPLRFGTRGSLLALAQTRLVMAAVRAVHPERPMELVPIETRGDRDRSTPLDEVNDPGFFSAELDQALLAGKVDVCVHSVKDLPIAPRAGIRRAAIPRREDPRDVVVFRAHVRQSLRDGRKLRIGSSSPRRTLHAGQFLREALPGVVAGPDLEFRPLRGPVEHRLRRIHWPEHDPRSLDGVILALAGIARLWADADGRAAIEPLLNDTRLMVLPLTECPTAPGQGALAVECRSDDAAAFAILQSIADPATDGHVATELKPLEALPELTQPYFGATCVTHEVFDTLLFARGQVGDESVSTLFWSRPPSPGSVRSWDGGDWTEASRAQPLPAPVLDGCGAIFIAHWRAVTPGLQLPDGARLWASGVESWRRLARRGYWVEGCAENLGFAYIVPTLHSPVLDLPPLSAWTVLTREDAVGSWDGSGIGRVLSTYSIEAPHEAYALERIRERVRGATHFYWGSAAQFRAVRDWLPPDAHHACGPGKTYHALRRAGIEHLQPFPSRREWRRWVA